MIRIGKVIVAYVGEKKEEKIWYEKGCDAYWHHTLALNLKA